MKHTLQNLCAVAAALLFALPAASQLSGTGYYRFRNAAHSDYISIANDKFNYHTCISTAGGNLSGMMTSAGKVSPSANAPTTITIMLKRISGWARNRIKLNFSTSFTVPWNLAE